LDDDIMVSTTQVELEGDGNEASLGTAEQSDSAVPSPKISSLRRKQGMASTDAAWKQGQKDAQTGQGQKSPSSFTNDADRKNYQAGYDNGKKK
jgi:hypothetical protein